MSGTGTNGHIDFTFSMVKFAADTKPTDYGFRALIDGIRDGAWRGLVEQVRSAYQSELFRVAGLPPAEAIDKAKDAAKPFKMKLPGALLSGRFAERNDGGIRERTPAICCDLDGLSNPEGLRDLVVADPHVIACFLSPTGTGLKVVFRIDPAKSHAECYRAAEHYVREIFGEQIDSSCRNLSRLCFVSYDPEAFLADDALPLPDAPPLVEIPELPRQAAARVTLPVGTISPGDDYDQRGDWRGILRQAGWSEQDDHFWTRPGHTKGVSASWNTLPDHPNRFYCFSTNGAPFEVGPLYKPWHIYAKLCADGVYQRACDQLYDLGYGTRRREVPAEALPDDSYSFGEPATPTDPLAYLAPEPTKPTLTGRSLMDFKIPAPDDPAVLVGDRYISRGDVFILSSTSGMGKSSLTVQMAAHWALSRPPLAGMPAKRPLKSLIFQSEDNDGDVAEVKHSLIHAMKLTAQEQIQVGANVIIVTDRIHRGASLITELKLQIEVHHPDIIWINPLLAFIGGDVNEAEAVGLFIREQLNSLNEPPRHAYGIVHHTSKPPKDKAERRWSEVMYDMAGSADLTNSARAIISLRAADKRGHFNLVFAKRERRAGFTKQVEQGAGFRDEPIAIIGVRHSTDRMTVDGRDLPVIFWERCDAEEDAPKATGRPRNGTFEDFTPIWPVGIDAAKGFRPLLREAQEIRPTAGNTSLMRIVDEAIAAGRLVIDNRTPRQPKYYAPKPAA